MVGHVRTYHPTTTSANLGAMRRENVAAIMRAYTHIHLVLVSSSESRRDLPQNRPRERSKRAKFVRARARFFFLSPPSLLRSLFPRWFFSEINKRWKIKQSIGVIKACFPPRTAGTFLWVTADGIFYEQSQKFKTSFRNIRVHIAAN